MTDRKHDELLATGTHRRWVGEANNRPSVRAGTPPRETQQNWLERAQPSSRHGAITRSLYSWSNYKSWTERVKNSFDKDKHDKK